MTQGKPFDRIYNFQGTVQAAFKQYGLALTPK